MFSLLRKKLILTFRKTKKGCFYILLNCLKKKKYIFFIRYNQFILYYNKCYNMLLVQFEKTTTTKK